MQKVSYFITLHCHPLITAETTDIFNKYLLLYNVDFPVHYSCRKKRRQHYNFTFLCILLCSFGNFHLIIFVTLHAKFKALRFINAESKTCDAVNKIASSLQNSMLKIKLVLSNNLKGYNFQIILNHKFILIYHSYRIIEPWKGSSIFRQLTFNASKLENYNLFYV